MKQLLQRIKSVEMIRRLTQITAFILLPGLFTTIFYEIKELYTSLIGGTFTSTTITSDILPLAAIIVTTVLFGRYFCGFFCSFGAMGDLLWFISRKTIKPNVKISERVDAVLKYLKYAILLFIVIFIWSLGLLTIDSMGNPWNIFGIYSSISGWTSIKYLLTVGGVLLLMIIAGSLVVERFFCRYLCPLGAIFAVSSRARLFNIRKKRDNCGSCRVCTNQCSMGIPLYQQDKVTSGECIHCFACISKCPRKNAQINPAPAVASVVSVAAISSLMYVGNVASASSSGSYTIDSAAMSELLDGTYSDGTYTGTGSGFRGDTTVSVIVENGYIESITVLSYEDDYKYFVRAESTVINDILENQEVDVDAVTGATFSSNSIMEAVANALNVDYTNTNSTLSRGHGGPGRRH